MPNPIHDLLTSPLISWPATQVVRYEEGRFHIRGWTPADGSQWYGIKPAGLALIDEWSHEPYRMVYITERADPVPALITYAEGDVDLEAFASVDAFEAGMERARLFYDDGRWPAVLELAADGGTQLRRARSWLEWATMHRDYRSISPFPTVQTLSERIASAQRAREEVPSPDETA